MSEKAWKSLMQVWQPVDRCSGFSWKILKNKMKSQHILAVFTVYLSYYFSLINTKIQVVPSVVVCVMKEHVTSLYWLIFLSDRLASYASSYQLFHPHSNRTVG